MGVLFDSYALDVLVTLATLAYIVYAFLTSTYSYWKDRGVPYKKPSLFFGNMKDMFVGRKALTDIHWEIYKEAPDASAIGFFEFKNPTLMIRDPELAEKVLIKDFTSFHDRSFPYDLENEPLSGNLFTVEGSYWRNLRYKLTPTFTTGKLKSMFEQMYNSVDDLIKYIEKQSKLNNDFTFEAKQLITVLSVDVIASCAFGLEFSAESEEGKRFRRMIGVAFKKSMVDVFRFYLLNHYPKVARKLKITNFPPESNEYFMNISKETIKYRRENNVKRNDFLQLILTLQEQELNNKIIMEDDTTEEDAVLNQLENAPNLDNNASSPTKIFTDECLAAQCFAFLGAGSEAVANVGSFCLYALAANTQVQEKLRHEVDTVLERHNGKWTYAAVKEMKYLDQVLNETHRRYPSAGFLNRKCTKPFKIPDSKYVVEPNTRVLIPVSCFHLDEKYFPDPHAFDPERFAEDKTILKGTFMPFGDGPRICIGMRFATVEIKVCVAWIVSEFNIRISKKTIQPLKYEPMAFFLTPKGGLWLEFDKRIKS